tara:strand:- start:1796 stop:2131 length:336 start_codon:yes stop_codon:yes gene_type:complete
MNCTLTPKEFIGGEIFTIVSNFEDTIVTVLSYVTKKNGVYSLHIKGDYPRGSGRIITIGNDVMDISIDEMFTIAFKCIDEYVPFLIMKDYPLSLKKLKADKIKADKADKIK